MLAESDVSAQKAVDKYQLNAMPIKVIPLLQDSLLGPKLMIFLSVNMFPPNLQVHYLFGQSYVTNTGSEVQQC